MNNDPINDSDLLASLGHDLRAAVIGANGGLGAAFVHTLSQAPNASRTFALSRRSAKEGFDPIVTEHTIDLIDEFTVEGAAKHIRAECKSLHLVIVATGVLHRDETIQPEKTWRHLDRDVLSEVFATNTVGPALAMKHFLPLLARDRKAVFALLSARVGSISDNRLGGWYAYRASKAALNMLIKTASVELARVNPSALCIGLHPGTVATALSEPFQSGVPEGKLFSPDFSARSLLSVIDTLTPENSGDVFAWDGQRIPS